VKFEGGYHGMSRRGADEPRADPEVNFPQAVPDSAGIPTGVRDDAGRALQRRRLGHSLMASMPDESPPSSSSRCNGIIPPEPGFLEACARSATATASC
jgi:glutamate-1-semialdehyde 2,1-aminomutase